MRVAREALDQAHQLKSVRCVEYVRHLRERLVPYQDTAAVRDLTEYAADHPLWIAAG